MKYDIFISYSRSNLEKVIEIKDEIERVIGASCWIDKDGIESGDAFKAVIVNAIKNSKLFLFFSSQTANNSSWTVKEVNTAVHLKKIIIPVKLDNTEYNDSILFDLVGLDYVDYANDSNKSHQELLRAIKRHLDIINEEDNHHKEMERERLSEEKKRREEENTRQETEEARIRAELQAKLQTELELKRKQEEEITRKKAEEEIKRQEKQAKQEVVSQHTAHEKPPQTGEVAKQETHFIAPQKQSLVQTTITRSLGANTTGDKANHPTAIHIECVNENGHSIRNATISVKIGGKEHFLDAKKTLRFLPGNYELSAYAKGYHVYRETISITSKTHHLTIRLNKINDSTFDLNDVKDGIEELWDGLKDWYDDNKVETIYVILKYSLILWGVIFFLNGAFEQSFTTIETSLLILGFIACCIICYPNCFREDTDTPIFEKWQDEDLDDIKWSDLLSYPLGYWYASCMMILFICCLPFYGVTCLCSAISPDIMRYFGQYEWIAAPITWCSKNLYPFFGTWSPLYQMELAIFVISIVCDCLFLVAAIIKRITD